MALAAPLCHVHSTGAVSGCFGPMQCSSRLMLHRTAGSGLVWVAGSLLMLLADALSASPLVTVGDRGYTDHPGACCLS
jgi:hypothetical protein